MKQGVFHDFYLAYKQRPPGDSERQAREILDKARSLIMADAIGVGITYSATYDQSPNLNDVIWSRRPPEGDKS